MNYIGVDLHKDSMSIIGVRKNGDIFVKERIPTKCIGKIEKFFSQDSIHPCVVICESIGFYHWFYDLISNKVEKFILANTVETKKYSWNNPKTDFRDATKLALLFAGGEFERNRSICIERSDHSSCVKQVCPSWQSLEPPHRVASNPSPTAVKISETLVVSASPTSS